MKTSSLILFLTAGLLTACAGSPHLQHPLYAPADPIVYPEANPVDNSGSIYVAGRRGGLFEDFRARRVGDVLTVTLSESTSAAKSSDTAIDQETSNNIENPIIGGALGSQNLEFDLGSSNAFSGAASSNQSNSLNGEITVTVAEVLPNGNLYIQGEKWIKINQGDEYIRLRGVVRPEDISADNLVLSTRIADARISYSGTGAPAEANTMGWVSRFFNSPIWPF